MLISRIGRNAPARSTSVLDIHRRKPIRELARLCGSVVALHMLSRARDGEHIEQLEVVEAEHIHEASGPPVGLGQIKAIG